MRHLAAAAGLVIDSDIPLPGLCPASGPASYSLSIDSMNIGSDAIEWIQHWTAEGRTWLSCGRVVDGYVLRVEQTADVFIDLGRRRIVCEPCPGTPLETLARIVSGQIVPRLLSLDGTPVLHASAVAIDEAAIVLVGESGAGKSTLAAALCRAGGGVLADDFVAVRAEANGFLCPPTSTGVSLGPAAIDLLRHTTSRAPAPWRGAVSALPIGVIYVLQASSDGMPSIEPLHQRNAYMRLFGLSYRMESKAPTALGSEFSRLAALVAAVPVRTLTVPRVPHQLRASAEAILQSTRAAARS